MPKFDVSVIGELNLDLIFYGLPQKLELDPSVNSPFHSRALFLAWSVVPTIICSAACYNECSDG